MDAITKAIAGLSKGDLLIIAGKGHERDQHVAGKVLPFNDSDAVKSIVNGER